MKNVSLAGLSFREILVSLFFFFFFEQKIIVIQRIKSAKFYEKVVY